MGEKTLSLSKDQPKIPGDLLPAKMYPQLRSNRWHVASSNIKRCNEIATAMRARREAGGDIPKSWIDLYQDSHDKWVKAMFGKKNMEPVGIEVLPEPE